MAAYDVHANLAVSTVATAPSPATSGTSLVVAAGQGARFPAPPFNATVQAAGVNPDPSNAEIVRVTAIATDTLTITRAQEGTTARTVVVGDQVALTVSAKTLTDIETLVGTRAAPAQSGALRMDNAQYLTARNFANGADVNLLSLDTSDRASLMNGLMTVNSSGFVSLGTNPSVSGILRLQTNQWITARNTANSADMNLWKLNANDLLQTNQVVIHDDMLVGTTYNTYLLMARKMIAAPLGASVRENCITARMVSSQAGTVTEGRIGVYVTMEDDPTTTVNKTITGAVNNGSGLIRITATAHGFSTGNKVNIYGVGGVTAANGVWVITVIDANTFDLQSSTFSGTYTSGGTATTRSLMYGVMATVNPTLSRGGLAGTGANGDDVNCFVGYNGGTGKAVDAYYLSAASTFTKTVSGAVNNGSGLARLTVTGHGWATGQQVMVNAVGGVTLSTLSSASGGYAGAPSFWSITVIDANTFDLVGSTFAGTYTSGGTATISSFTTSFTLGAPADYGIRMIGSYLNNALDFYGAVMPNGGIAVRLGNDHWIAARNQADNADLKLFELNRGNNLEIAQTLFRDDLDTNGNAYSTGRFLSFRRLTTTTSGQTETMNARVYRQGAGSLTDIAEAAEFAAHDYSIGQSANITGVSNATPIVVTTATVHGLTTGDFVTLVNVTGNTAATGTWRVTVVTTTTFSLDGSVGNGTYTSDNGWYLNKVTQQTITGATNATPIVITTANPHRWATGEKVSIWGVLGNTAANTVGGSARSITVLSTTTFSLDGSVGNGAYTSGGFVTNRGAITAVSAMIQGTSDRGNLLGADDLNCFVGYNDGWAKGTDAYYLGHNAVNFPARSEFTTCFTMGAWADFGIRCIGTYVNNALDFYGGTFTNGMVRYKNASWNLGRNAADTADLQLYRINANNQFETAQPILTPQPVNDGHGAIRHFEIVTSAAATLQTALGVARTVTSAVAATNQKDARGEWLRISATTTNADASLAAATFTETRVDFDPLLETRVQIPTAIVNMRVFIGLFSAAAVMTTDTQSTIHSAYFRFSTGASDTVWQCCTSNASATQVQTSGVTVAANTVYLLRIDCTDAANIKFYINGALVATNSTTVPTSTTNLGPGHYLRSLTNTGQKDVDVEFTAIYQA